jgi:hypothetical protein
MDHYHAHPPRFCSKRPRFVPVIVVFLLHPDYFFRYLFSTSRHGVATDRMTQRQILAPFRDVKLFTG